MKITRAMELIATARIGKAQARLNDARPYSEKLNEVIRNVAAAGSAAHPLLETRQPNTIGVLVITSDRGLAGSYNTSVIRMAERQIQEHRSDGREVRLYVVGNKAQAYFRYRNHVIANAWLDVTDLPAYGDARAVANVLIDEYQSGAVDAVEVFTTRYVSALTQTPVRRPLLPSSRRRSSRENQQRPGTRSSQARRRSWTGCCLVTWREACSAFCSTPRPRNMRLGGGR